MACKRFIKYSCILVITVTLLSYLWFLPFLIQVNLLLGDFNKSDSYSRPLFVPSVPIKNTGMFSL